jgi:hypothetical protein
MRPALDPAGHQVPRTKPTCLLHTWRPHRRRPFALVLHLHHHQSSRNLHLQYLAKNQSIQRCQSLITQGSDYPPVLEPHMVLRIAVRDDLTVAAGAAGAVAAVRRSTGRCPGTVGVHTTLSITHHTRKRLSTGPRTTHGPQDRGEG